MCVCVCVEFRRCRYLAALLAAAAAASVQAYILVLHASEDSSAASSGNCFHGLHVVVVVGGVGVLRDEVAVVCNSRV